MVDDDSSGISFDSSCEISLTHTGSTTPFDEESACIDSVMSSGNDDGGSTSAAHFFKIVTLKGLFIAKYSFSVGKIIFFISRVNSLKYIRLCCKLVSMIFKS